MGTAAMAVMLTAGSAKACDGKKNAKNHEDGEKIAKSVEKSEKKAGKEQCHGKKKGEESASAKKGSKIGPDAIALKGNGEDPCAGKSESVELF